MCIRDSYSSDSDDDLDVTWEDDSFGAAGNVDAAAGAKPAMVESRGGSFGEGKMPPRAAATAAAETTAAMAAGPAASPAASLTASPAAAMTAFLPVTLLLHYLRVKRAGCIVGNHRQSYRLGREVGTRAEPRNLHRVLRIPFWFKWWSRRRR